MKTDIRDTMTSSCRHGALTSHADTAPRCPIASVGSAHSGLRTHRGLRTSGPGPSQGVARCNTAQEERQPAMHCGIQFLGRKEASNFGVTHPPTHTTFNHPEGRTSLLPGQKGCITSHFPMDYECVISTTCGLGTVSQWMQKTRG